MRRQRRAHAEQNRIRRGKISGKACSRDSSKAGRIGKSLCLTVSGSLVRLLLDASLLFSSGYSLFSTGHTVFAV